MKFEDMCSGEEFDSDDLPLQVCMSNAGYYIGQLEPCGAAFSRLSGYFKTRADAETHLRGGFQDRGTDENKEVVEGLVNSGKLTRASTH